MLTITFFFHSFSTLHKECHLEWIETNDKYMLSFKSRFVFVQIPGVIEFSLCLFFNKFVTYSFMYWLPNFISLLTNYDLSSQSSAYIATAFDFGGLVGGMVLGHVSGTFGF